MNRLLAAVNEVECLTGQRLIVKDRRQNLDDLGMRPQLAGRFAVLVKVVDSLSLEAVLQDARGHKSVQIAVDSLAIGPRDEFIENHYPSRTNRRRWASYLSPQSMSGHDLGNVVQGVGTVKPRDAGGLLVGKMG